MSVKQTWWLSIDDVRGGWAGKVHSRLLCDITVSYIALITFYRTFVNKKGNIILTIVLCNNTVGAY